MKIPDLGLPDREELRVWAREHPWRAGFYVAGWMLLFILLLTWLTLPRVGRLAEGWPENTAFMRADMRAADTESVDYRPVALSRIPQRVRRAVLVSEDAAFYEHGGFDFHELKLAMEEAWEEKSFPRGASTITQQLARNLYLSRDRNIWRKIREAAITRRIEQTLEKDRILELYLNVIEFGPRIYGVEAASRHYFGTTVSNLSNRQAAELAATIPAPVRSNPATRTRGFHFRSRLAFARAFGGANPDTIPPAPDVVLDPIDPEAPGRVEAQVDSAEAAVDSPTADTIPATADPPPDSAAARRDTLAEPSETGHPGRTVSAAPGR